MLQLQTKQLPSHSVKTSTLAIAPIPGASQQSAKTRLLKISSVLERVPVSRTEWYRRIRKGTAPAPLSLSVNSVAWLESDIDAFIDALPKVAAK
ncbi:putative DNA-binding transcriptional regulator AlpA [Oxalobacteraceae bacterium GrIS 1.11]